jgi:hypothetical protein
VRLRTLGLVLTVVAVVVLLVSLVLGLRAPPPPPDDGFAAALEAVRSSPARPPVRVEVLNAAGLPGVARDVTDLLRDRGFDVVHYGNASVRRDSTAVLNRSGDHGSAARVAEALGIERLETAIDTTLYLEATVILGGDWPDIVERER